MDHKPLPVVGYKSQSTENIKIVNELKIVEERLLRCIEHLEQAVDEYGVGYDRRWLAIGRTHIQQGFMAVARSVFKPTRVRLPEDEPGDNE